MKRSETVLVYAVTAVLAVILVVAVVFGGDPEPVEKDRGAKLDELMYGAGGDSEKTDGGGLGGVGELAGDPAEASVERDEVGTTGDERPGAGDEVALRAPGQSADAQVRALLGPFETVEHYDGTVYRRVTVRPGDSFDKLLYDWTGSRELLEDVRAVNETLDPNHIRAGEEILFPWVDGRVLLRRLEDAGRRVPAAQPEATRAPALERIGSGGPVPLRSRSEPAASTPAPSATAPSGATGGESYTVKPGESLWKIAERKVGPGKATAYINDILAANPSISDASKVREGQTIVLP